MGRVVDVESSRSSGSHGTSFSYYPVVEYQAPSGEKIRFRSSVGTNPPSHNTGESVGVMFDAKNPHHAKIDSFSDTWLLSTVLCGMGLPFAIIGLLTIFFQIRRRIRMSRARNHGQPVSAKIVEVGLDQSLEINGHRPFVITAQWQDPGTGLVHIFKSEQIWYDPRQFIKGDSIKVLVEPGNPKCYYVDISALPKLAA